MSAHATWAQETTFLDRFNKFSRMHCCVGVLRVRSQLELLGLIPFPPLF